MLDIVCHLRQLSIVSVDPKTGSVRLTRNEQQGQFDQSVGQLGELTRSRTVKRGQYCRT